MAKERIHYIDILKAICILLIVGMHTNCEIYPGRFDAILKSFPVPMFFFLSGLFFKSYSGTKEFIAKKTDSLIIPFLFFYGISCLMAFVCSEVFHLNEKGLMGDKWEWQYLYEPFLYSKFHFSLALWFLLSLFEINIIYLFLNKLKPWAKYLGIIICPIVGYLLIYHDIILPAFLNCALVSLPFFAFGVALKELDMLRINKGAKLGLILIIPLCIILYLFAEPLDMPAQKIPHPAILYSVPTITLFSLTLFCKNIPYVPIVNHIGRYSLIILGTHSQLVSAIRPFVVKIFGAEVIGGIVLVAAIVIVELLIIPIMIRIFPWFIGQKPLLAAPLSKMKA